MPAELESYDDVGSLLDDLYEAMTDYIIFPSESATVATVLWTAATHAQPVWEIATRLVIKSPVRRCGKSRVLDVVTEAAHYPLITVNMSIAAIVRSINIKNPPTLLIDEADTIWTSSRSKSLADKNEELRGLLNAGHQRNRPVVRWDITTRSLERLHSFAMAAFASIGDLPDTIEDRAVVVSMRRRATGEKVQPWRHGRDAPRVRKLGKALNKAIRSHMHELEASEPELPVEDRDADNWASLVAVADLAGGDWPERARAACLELCAGNHDPTTDQLSIRLLADLQQIFRRAQADKLPTETILHRLYTLDDEAPWASLNRGMPLDARGLARMLRPYGVESKNVAVANGKRPKGYTAADLVDPWRRYLRGEDEQPWVG